MHNTSWLRVETLKETLKLACHQKDFKFINFISFVDSVINNYYHDTDEKITVTSITIPNKNRIKFNCLFSVRAETSHILFTSRLRMETLNEPFQLRLKPFGGLGRGLWWLGEGDRGRGKVCPWYHHTSSFIIHCLCVQCLMAVCSFVPCSHCSFTLQPGFSLPPVNTSLHSLVNYS